MDEVEQRTEENKQLALERDHAKRERTEKGRFFPLDIGVVREIVTANLEVEEVLGYIILAAHTQGYGAHPHRLCSSGVNSLQTKGGMANRRAQKVVKALAQGLFIQPADEAREVFGEEVVPRQLGKSKYKPRFWICRDPTGSEKAVNLPQALIHGIAGGKELPPLARLYQEIATEPNEGITASQARLDAVMLLMHLYQHHQLEECGGVDPRGGLYRQWGLAADDDGALQELALKPVEDLPGTNAAVFEVRGGNSITYHAFADHALFHVPKDERMPRFWCALRNLERLGFLYETVAVWSGDPNKNRKAEPLYTLYIRDKKARENGEPYLQRVVHSTISALWNHNPETLWGDVWTSPGVIELSKQQGAGFRFIANKKKGGYPIGIYRLRYRPWDRETGVGIKREERRVQEWKTSLAGLR